MLAIYIYIRFIRDTTMALPVTWFHWKTPSTMAELGRSLCLNNRMASTWRTVSDAVHLNESFLKDILIMVCVRAHVSVCIYMYIHIYSLCMYVCMYVGR